MEKVGKYNIVGKLGSGGMGVVYKALDPLLERVVALKTIHAHLDVEPDLRLRFFREGRSAAHLSHKNIITVYDLGEDNGIAYLAMEFLEGADLKTKISRNEIQGLNHKLAIMIEICEGLAHAHSRSVIHRDIKPANIFITNSGQTKILDFGLARLMSSDITRTGHTFGTPNYMSPEQVRGEQIDARTDIFSAGSVFYELLTLRKAFDADSVTATITKILSSDPEPIESIDPSLDLDLALILKRALAKDLNGRYQSIEELLVDLRKAKQRVILSSETSTGRVSEDASAALLDSESPTLTAPVTGLKSNRRTRDARPSIWHGKRFRTIRYPLIALVIGALALTSLWIIRSGTPRARDKSSTHPIGVQAERSGPIGIAGLTRPPAESASANPDLSAHSGAGPEISRTVPAPGPEGTRETTKPDQRAASGKTTQSGETMNRISQGNQKTRSLIGEGKHAEATAELGEVLKVAPSDSEAIQLAARLNAHVAKSADDAMEQMLNSKKEAESASAGEFAERSFDAAQKTEIEAKRLYDLRRFGEASAKLFEARGLYLSASLEAKSEKQARENHNKLLEQQRVADQNEADLARKSYEQELSEAKKADAAAKVPQSFQDAVALASEAQLEWSRGDFPSSRKDFERAMQMMHRARIEAVEASRNAENLAIAKAPKSESRASPPRTTAEDDKQAISGVMKQYVSALASRDLQMLKSVWPSLGGQREQALREEFKNARELRAQFSEVEIKLNADSAIVTARCDYAIQTTDGQRLQTNTNATISLSRIGKLWLIENVRYEAAR